MSKQGKKITGCCENCAYYNYDDEAATYVCDAMLDEDELYRFLQSDTANCPYYRPYDEYKVVQRQN